jgi:hypothetical protein
MPADFHPRDLRQGIPHRSVHLFHRGARLRFPRDIRLVRHDHKEIARCFELSAASRHVFVQFEVPRLRGGVWPAVADNRLIDHSVAIEKDRAPPHFVLSH